MASSSDRRRRLARERHERAVARRAAAARRARQRRRNALAAAAAVVAVAVVAALAVFAVRRTDGAAATAEPSPSPAAGTCAWQPSQADAGEAAQLPPAEPDTAGPSTATLTLEGLGDVTLALDAARAPCAVTSFRALAAQGFFDGTRCHRLTTAATLRVLQCGDPTGTGSGGPGYSFADEALEGAAYPAGTVAMANAGADSNGSQFFLVYGDSELPPSYTPLGRITGGLPVLREVAAAGVEGGGEDGAPARAAVLASVALDPPFLAPPASPAPGASP